MSTLREVQAAIGGLSAEEQETLLAWLLESERAEWDEQIARDFGAGEGGRKWLAEIDAQIRNGKFHSME